jgi:hypothetical protein
VIRDCEIGEDRWEIEGRYVSKLNGRLALQRLKGGRRLRERGKSEKENGNERWGVYVYKYWASDNTNSNCKDITTPLLVFLLSS